jgi:hypothetical protein
LDTGDRVLTNNQLLNVNDVRTIFPSFNIEQIDMNDNRGYFTFQGIKVIFFRRNEQIFN